MKKTRYLFVVVGYD